MGNCTDQYTSVYCTQFAAQLDVILKTLTGIETMMRIPIKKLFSMLEELLSSVESDKDALNAKLSKLRGQVDAQIPGQECINELLDIANKCDIIKKSVQIKGVKGLTFDLGGPINILINKTFDDFKIIMTSFVEYPVAVYADTINGMLKASHIKDTLDKISKLRICADALCSGRLQSQFNQLDIIIGNLYISEDDGLIDMQKIYAGMQTPVSANIQININTCINELAYQKNSAASKLADSVNSIIDAKNAITSLF